MRISLIVVFTIIYLSAAAQLREAIISDTSVVSFSVLYNDTSYFIKPPFRSGEWIIYYDKTHFQKATSINFNYANNDFTFSEWYRNGQIKSEFLTPMAYPERLNAKLWYPDGRLKGISQNYPDSCTSYDYYPNGQLSDKLVSRFDSTSEHPKSYYHAVYFDNGQLIHDPWDSQNGERQIIISYYPSGKRKKQVEIYNELSCEGPYKEWYENGNLKVEGTYEIHAEGPSYSPSQRTGKWTYYNESGKKIKEEFYEANKLINTVTY